MTELPERPVLDLGRARIHWLDGGAFRLDGGAMFGPVPKSRWSQRYPCDADNLIPLAARPLLVETAQGWLLIDSGFGHHLPERLQQGYQVERLGRLEAGLAELGLSTKDIAWVVLTHLHLDHASGLVHLDADGQLRPLFPHARHVVQRRELEQMAHPHERERHAYHQPSWQPLADAGLLEVIDGSREIAPGVEVFFTGGHSPGHQGVLLTAQKGAAVHLGDLLPTAAHLRPLWISALDDYPLDSIAAKQRWLERVAAEGWWLTFYHDYQVLAAGCTRDYELDQQRLLALQASGAPPAD